MDEAVAAVIVPGLAFGGVLAVAAGWSRAARSGLLPHLGVGALAAVAVTLGVRLDTVPVPLALLLVVAAGGGLGRVAQALDGRWASGSVLPVPLADMVVLGGAVAVVGVLAPVGIGVVQLGASGPLGGVPGTAGGLAAVAVGVGSAVVLLPARVAGRIGPLLTAKRRWAAAGAAVAASAALAAGTLSPAGAGDMVVLVAADPVGLALRTAAAAVAGRGQPGEAAAAGMALGFIEALLRAVDPSGVTAVLPAVGMAVLGILAGGVWPARTRVAAGWS